MDDKLRIFFIRSRIRNEVLKELGKKPQIASFLARDMHKNRVVISQIFKDLKDKGWVKCSNPENSNFKFYELTKKGKEILTELAEYEESTKKLSKH